MAVAGAGLLLLWSGLAVLALATDLALLDLAKIDIVLQEQVARDATWSDECVGRACARRKRGWDEVVVMEWWERDGLPMVRAFGVLF